MSDPRDRPPHDPDAPISDEERHAAEQLRAALDDPARGHPEAELARSLQAAWSPRDLTAAQHDELVRRALAAHRDGAGRRGRVVRVSFGASAIVALAASVLLALWSGRPPRPDGSGPSLAVSRSTQALFHQTFAPTGGETARIDRIAMARAADLRDNEFAKWGVR